MTAASDLSRMHHRAIFDLLDDVGQDQFFGKVDVPDTELAYPYLIVWPAPGHRQILNLAGNLSDVTTLSQVTAVGRDVDEVLATLDRAAALLHGHRPTIVGRLVGLIRQQESGEYVRPDDTVHTPDGQPTYMGVAFFTLNSTAAPAS